MPRSVLRLVPLCELLRGTRIGGLVTSGAKRMDAPQKKSNPPAPRVGPGQADGVRLPEFLQKQVDAIDETAILNELIAAISPELLNLETRAETIPAPAATPAPPPAPAPRDKQQPSPPREQKEEVEEPTAKSTTPLIGLQIRPEEVEEAISSILGPTEPQAKVEKEKPAEKKEAPPPPKAEPAPPPPEPSKAKAGPKVVAPPIKPPAKQEFDSVDDALSALWGKGEEETSTAVEPVAEAPTAAPAAPPPPAPVSEPAPPAPSPAVAEKAPAEPAKGPAVEGGEIPPDLVPGLARMVATHYLNLLGTVLPSGATPPPAAEKAPPEPEAAPPPAETPPAEEKPFAGLQEADVTADLLADFIVEEREGEGEEQKEPEPASLDEVVSSAILEPPVEEKTEEPVPVGEPEATVAGEEGAEEKPAPWTGPIADIGGDDVIAEMAKEHRRTKLIGWIIVAFIAVAFASFFFGPKLKELVSGPSTGTTGTTAAVTPAPTPQPAPAADSVAQPAPPPTPVPASEATTPAPSPSVAAPTPAPAPPAARPAGGAPQLPTSPGGRFTVHVESLPTLGEANAAKSKWQRRGYEALVWPFTKNDGSQWYRVGVGRFATKADGQTAKSALESAFPEIDWSQVTQIPEGAN